jgi:hypothetical protein
MQPTKRLGRFAARRLTREELDQVVSDFLEGRCDLEDITDDLDYWTPENSWVN